MLGRRRKERRTISDFTKAIPMRRAELNIGKTGRTVLCGKDFQTRRQNPSLRAKISIA